MTSWYDPLVVLTGAIALCTFVYAIITTLIWRETARNTNATRQMLESSNRPYLGVQNVSIHHEHMQQSSVLIVVQNVGSVPSHRVEIDLEINLADGTSSVFDWGSRPPVALMPKQLFTCSQDISSIMRGKPRSDLGVKVEIRYCGASDKQYRTDAAYACDEVEQFTLVSGEML